MDKTITVVEARDNFSELVSEVAYGQHFVILTRHGKNVAAIVPMDVVNLIGRLEDKTDIEKHLKQKDAPAVSFRDAMKEIRKKKVVRKVAGGRAALGQRQSVAKKPVS